MASDWEVRTTKPVLRPCQTSKLLYPVRSRPSDLSEDSRHQPMIGRVPGDQQYPGTLQHRSPLSAYPKELVSFQNWLAVALLQVQREQSICSRVAHSLSISVQLIDKLYSRIKKIGSTNPGQLSFKASFARKVDNMNYFKYFNVVEPNESGWFKARSTLGVVWMGFAKAF